MNTLNNFAERCLGYLECNEDSDETTLLLVQGYCAMAQILGCTPIALRQRRLGKGIPMPGLSVPMDAGEFEWGSEVATELKSQGIEAVYIAIIDNDGYDIEIEMEGDHVAGVHTTCVDDSYTAGLIAGIVQEAISSEGLKVFRDREEWDAYRLAEPKFAIGETVYLQSRYEGVVKRVVVSVRRSDEHGFEYELDRAVEIGKDGYSVGSEEHYDGELAPEEYLMRLGDRVYNTHPILRGVTDNILTEEDINEEG